MIDINRIRTDAESVNKALAKRNVKVDFSELLKWDAQRKAVIQKAEALKSERNQVSAQVPALKKAGKPTEEVFSRMRAIGEDISALDAECGELDNKINDFLLRLPNTPDDDIVSGDKEANEAIKYFGKKPEFKFAPKNHVDICNNLSLIDYDRGAKLSGAGYWLYRGMGARLEWALLNYFIDTHIKDGYEFILPPHMLSYSCGLGAGQFPKFVDEDYWIDEGNQKREHFMLPTAETALVNIFGGEILDEDKLPVKLFAYTPCFRKEAGSYRAEERGMIRGHQFNKVEMVQYTTPENSRAAFDELVNKACALADGLGLHFRLSKLAGADISATMARTYDIEVWIPSMGIYKEVSSVSCANDYQARRNNTRYRCKATNKPAYVHTLNGSGLATSRIMPAIVEQFQNEDGSVTVPKVLRPYLGGLDRIEKIK